MLFSILSSLFLAVLIQATSVQNAPIRPIFTFPKNTFIENIRVRSSGSLILTSQSVSDLYSIDPTSSSPNATVVHTFPNSTGLAGITELTPDIFAVVSADWDLVNTRAILGTLVVWTVDFNCVPVEVKRLANVSNTTSFNGIASLKQNPHLVLAADSALGAVWRINTLTGEYGILFTDPLFEPVSSELGLNLGINGLRIKGGYLYLTNSARGIFGRVEIDGSGNKRGKVQVISNITDSDTVGAHYDDFAIDGKGTAWIATHPDYVVGVEVDGKQNVIANETLLLNPTSAAFGRGSRREEGTLYVTNGGLFVGNDLVDEGVVAVDLRKYH